MVEDVKVNFKDIKDKSLFFLKKYYLVILILIPILLSISLRMYPADLPILNEYAKQSADNYYKNILAQQILQQYPNLPTKQITSLVEEQYKTYYSSNKATIDQQVINLANQMKEQYKDENGYTYSSDIDTYAHLRYARNYLDHGYIGDEYRIINGKQVMFDNHMVAPEGTPINDNLHPKVLAYLYKGLHTVNPKITLMQSSNYLPIIFMILAIIPIFFIGRRFGGNVGALFSSLIFVTMPALIMRTSWSHYDTDIWTIFFPVYVVWFLFLSIDSLKRSNKIMYAGASGLMLGLFANFWSGWWYLFDFIVGGVVVYALYLFIFKLPFEHIKEYAISIGVFVVSTAIFVSLFTSIAALISSIFIQPFEFLLLKSASHASLWPNVYTTVAELNAPSFATIISQIGGSIFFYGAITGLILMAILNKRELLYHAAFLGLWFIGILYASTSGIRFIMMLTIPVTLAFGYLISVGYNKAISYTEGKVKTVFSFITIVLMVVFLMPQVSSDYNSLKQDVPMVNDAWYNTYTKINIESQPNAIVNSWWDLMHHAKYFTDRAVTFDGASQNTPMAHWIGKVLLTNNEDQAVGILRMLDCGSNTVFDKIDVQFQDTSESVKYLYNQISQGYKFCDNPPENYFITSGDMVGKAGVFYHFGGWDFDKADMYMEGKSLSQYEFIKKYTNQTKLNESEIKNLYYQVKGITNEGDANTFISGWPGYGQSISCTTDNITINCGGILINSSSKDVDIQGKKPNSIVYMVGKQFTKKEFNNGIGQSFMLQHNEDSNVYVLTVASPEIVDSMFTRLYFFNGIGLQHFKLFDVQTEPSGQQIYVWKIQW